MPLQLILYRLAKTVYFFIVVRCFLFYAAIDNEDTLYHYARNSKLFIQYIEVYRM